MSGGKKKKKKKEDTESKIFLRRFAVSPTIKTQAVINNAVEIRHVGEMPFEIVRLYFKIVALLR